MSHIVIDARQYTTTTGRYTYRLIEYLQNLDAQHDYTILLKPSDMDGAEFKNPRFRKVACPYKEFTFAEQLKLLKQLKDLKPDLVHFGMTQQPVLYRGLHVTTMHDLTTLRFDNPAKNRLVFKTKQQVYKLVNHRVAQSSQRIIAPSHFVQKDIMNYFDIPVTKIVVTYESADSIQDPAEPLSILEGRPFIMYIGRPQPHKNLGRLIEAFGLLRRVHPDLQLVLAGKKDELYRQHEEQAARRGIDGILFTDFVSEGQLRWLYEHCLAYVFPSLSEGFGLPGLEAMRHGAPVISSNATCLPEIYGPAAQYFDPNDTRAIAEAISHVIGNDQLRQELIEKGRQQVGKYSWDRMARQTLDVYKQALDEYGR